MPDAPAAGGGGKGVVQDPTKQALFSICGFYLLYWFWLRINEVNGYLGREVIKPLFLFVGIICGPILLYVEWLFVNAIPEMQKKAGIEAKDDKVMDFVKFFVCWPWGVMNAQQKLNAIWQK